MKDLSRKTYVIDQSNPLNEIDASELLEHLDDEGSMTASINSLINGETIIGDEENFGLEIDTFSEELQDVDFSAKLIIEY